MSQTLAYHEETKATKSPLRVLRDFVVCRRSDGPLPFDFYVETLAYHEETKATKSLLRVLRGVQAIE